MQWNEVLHRRRRSIFGNSTLLPVLSPSGMRGWRNPLALLFLSWTRLGLVRVAPALSGVRAVCAGACRRVCARRAGACCSRARSSCEASPEARCGAAAAPMAGRADRAGPRRRPEAGLKIVSERPAGSTLPFSRFHCRSFSAETPNSSATEQTVSPGAPCNAWDACCSARAARAAFAFAGRADLAGETGNDQLGCPAASSSPLQVVGFGDGGGRGVVAARNFAQRLSAFHPVVSPVDPHLFGNCRDRLLGTSRPFPRAGADRNPCPSGWSCAAGWGSAPAAPRWRNRCTRRPAADRSGSECAPCRRRRADRAEDDPVRTARDFSP